MQPVTRQDDTKLFFLEDLQDIGERYSPKVLGGFFARHGIGGQYMAQTRLNNFLDNIVQVSESQVAIVGKLVYGNYVLFHVGLVSATLLFWFSSCWDDPRRNDPIEVSEWIGDVFPNFVTICVVVFVIAAGIMGEIFTCIQIVGNTRQLVCRKNLFLQASSIIAQISLFMDVISAVVIVRSGARLVVVISGSIFLTYLILSWIVIPLRLWWMDAAQLTSYRLSAIPWADLRNCIDTRMDGTGDRQKFFLTLSLACIAMNWRLMASVIESRLVGVGSPSSAPLILQRTLIAYIGCFSVQLIQVPVKIFFLLDYGCNQVVFISVPFTLLSALFICVINVFPLEPQDTDV